MWRWLLWITCYVKERHRVIILASWRLLLFFMRCWEPTSFLWHSWSAVRAFDELLYDALSPQKPHNEQHSTQSLSSLSFFCDFLTRLCRKLSIMCIKNYYWIPPRNYFDSKARLIHLKASAHDNSSLVCKILEQSETMNYCVFRRLRKNIAIECENIKSPSKLSCRLDWFACRCFPTRKLRQSEKICCLAFCIDNSIELRRRWLFVRCCCRVMS